MTEQQKTEREKLLDKIRALLSKTTESGCTEGEYLAALAKARADGLPTRSPRPNCGSPKRKAWCCGKKVRALIRIRSNGR